MRLEKLGSILTAIALALACNVARGSLETTAGITIDGKIVTDLELTLGADPWTHQIAVWAEMKPSSYGTELGFLKTDGVQNWYTSFKLCSTTGGTAIANDIISVSWVDTGISNAFTSFYQSDLSGSQADKFDATYTSSNNGSDWVGEIGVLNLNKRAVDLRGDYSQGGVLYQNIYQIGTIEVSYDPTRLADVTESDLGTYALILNDEVASEVYALNRKGSYRWDAVGFGSVNDPKMTMTLNTLTPEPGPVPDPEPGPVPDPEPGPVPNPEPGTWAMIAGIAIVGACCIKRRRAVQNKRSISI
ncbi:MAG: hypothetical protein PHE53_05580 [Thermoguttaceae bacterium]|nr:hypothetical protein [Thermoguttaceae bacterium]